ncbi:MAG: Fe-S cluster assembly ATPase SufC [Zetaproteobacteria bacterium]|nr:MAG: Fe-S cluster assembly ATPase SufC [Zetaproteobacteria bacterium]
MTELLRIENLHVRVGGREVLCGVDLSVPPGEVHAIMGPNGAGKSTLAGALMGRPDCEITADRIVLAGEEITALSPEERAWKGLFLGFQHPVEVPGVSNLSFLQTALNAHRKAHEAPELDAFDFLELARSKAQEVGLAEAHLSRGVNEGFSGGERKRNEIFQMMLLEPKVAVLDEIDSGLDVDALKAVARGINAMRSPERSFLLITHYHRLLNEVRPDRVHVMLGGRIVRSGDAALAEQIDARGYDWLIAEAV